MTFDEWWKKRSHLFPEGWVWSIARDAWLAALESREEWVSVETALPRLMERLQVEVEDGDIYIGHREKEGRDMDDMKPEGDIWWSLNNDQEIYHVRRWRYAPLPAPPSTPSTEEKGTR